VMTQESALDSGEGAGPRAAVEATQPVSPYVFLVLCLIKQRDNFIPLPYCDDSLI
jgi:hypothetical protein